MGQALLMMQPFWAITVTILRFTHPEPLSIMNREEHSIISISSSDFFWDLLFTLTPRVSYLWSLTDPSVIVVKVAALMLPGPSDCETRWGGGVESPVPANTWVELWTLHPQGFGASTKKAACHDKYDTQANFHSFSTLHRNVCRGCRRHE